MVALACAGGRGPLEESESIDFDQEEMDTAADVIDPLGQSKAVEFTGSIEDERVGGLEILCGYYRTTYQPDLGSGDTHIRLLERQSDPDFGNFHQICLVQ